MQTDEAESQLTKLKKEYTTYKLETEKKVRKTIFFFLHKVVWIGKDSSANFLATAKILK